MTKEEESGSIFDRIWLLAGITTGITVVWLIWIFFEIILKVPPEV